MEELKDLRKIEKVGYNEELKAKTFTIEGIECVITGGPATASGVRNLLRSVNKILENKDDWHYQLSLRDVKYYVYNSTKRKMEKL